MSDNLSWAAGIDAAEFWSMGGFSGGIALVSIVALVVCRRRAQAILDTPTARVRSAPQGYVELRGQARADGPDLLRAPLTGRRCLWYRYTVQHLEKRQDRETWVTVREGTSEERFLLVDATGQCVIFPAGAVVSVTRADRWSGETEQPTGAPRRGATRPMLDSLGAGHRYRYSEERIHDGNRLYAIGWFRSVNAGDESPLARETREALSAAKSDGDALRRRFDRDGDGAVDLEEWQRARAVIADDVIAARARRSATGHVVHSLVKPPERRQPFLLSTKPQRELARQYVIGSWACGLLAATFSLTTAFLLLNR